MPLQQDACANPDPRLVVTGERLPEGCGGVICGLLAVSRGTVSLVATPASLGHVVHAVPQRLAVLFLVGGWAPLDEPLLQSMHLAGLPLRPTLWALALFGLLGIARRAPGPPMDWRLAVAALALLVPSLLLGLPAPGWPPRAYWPNLDYPGNRWRHGPGESQAKREARAEARARALCQLPN